MRARAKLCFELGSLSSSLRERARSYASKPWKSTIWRKHGRLTRRSGQVRGKVGLHTLRPTSFDPPRGPRDREDTTLRTIAAKHIVQSMVHPYEERGKARIAGRAQQHMRTTPNVCILDVCWSRCLGGQNQADQRSLPAPQELLASGVRAHASSDAVLLTYVCRRPGSNDSGVST